MRWQVRYTIDNCKALLPCQDLLRKWKQSILGYQADVRHHPGALADGCMQVEWLTERVGTLQNRNVLEIGTGWEPIIPLLYVLAGARVVYLTDLTKLVCEESLNTALGCIERNANRVCSVLQIPRTKIDSLLSADSSSRGLDSRLHALNLRYLAPCDCRKLDLPAASVDVVYSRAVLEHIPEPVLAGIFSEARRLLRPDGLMCHFIDNSDHSEHLDKTITRVHFLQHTDRMMRFINFHPQNSMNRLRHDDYARMMAFAGFSIVRSEREIDQRSLLALSDLKLSARFAGRPHDDLATITSQILAACA